MKLPKGDAPHLLDDLLPKDAHAELVVSLAGDPDVASSWWSHCSMTISSETCWPTT